MPFRPDEELTMHLTVVEWNQIIAELQNSPYRIAFPLINKINQQAAAHDKTSYQSGELQNMPAPPIPINRPRPVDVVTNSADHAEDASA
jgi:hypothetical protein